MSTNVGDRVVVSCLRWLIRARVFAQNERVKGTSPGEARQAEEGGMSLKSEILCGHGWGPQCVQALSLVTVKGLRDTQSFWFWGEQEELGHT